MQRKTPLIEGEYFHIYNRGVDKRKIFTDAHDYHRFIMLLYLCNSTKAVDIQSLFREGRTFAEMFGVSRGKQLVDIGAWVLMPNHFHLALCGLQDDGITIFLRKVCTGYSSYFNKKKKRTGSLFEGKFKAQHLSDENYLKYLFSYIHLNPIKLIDGENEWKEIGLKNKEIAENFIKKYEYSSFLDYVTDKRMYKNIINEDFFLDFHTSIEEMTGDMFEWFNFIETEQEDSAKSAKVGPSQEW